MTRRFLTMARLSVLLAAVTALPSTSLYSTAQGQESVASDLAKRLKGADEETKLTTINELENLGPGAKPAVGALAEQLKDDNATVRWHAARALGAVGPGAAAAVGAVVAALEDKDPVVRAHAVRTLGLIGEASKPHVKKVGMHITDDDERVRREVVRAFLRIKPDRSITIPMFTKIMEDSPQSVRLMVLHAMAEAGEEIVPVLKVAMGRMESRYWACLVLAEIGPEAKAAIPELLTAAKSDQFEVRMESLMALGAIKPKDEAVVRAIATGLEDKVGAVQYSAAYALGNIGPDAKIVGSDLMRIARTSKDEFLKGTAAWALVRVYPKQPRVLDTSMPILLRLLKHKEPSHRAAAAKALAELQVKPEITIPSLVGVLGDTETRVLSNAVEGLVKFGEPSLEPVTRALGTPRLRLGAVFVLKRFGEKARGAVPKLVAAMSDEKSLDVRREIFFALAAIGPGSKDAVPSLVEALDHENVKVRNGAAYALGKIGPDARGALPALRRNMSNKDDEYIGLISAWAMAQIDYQNAETVAGTMPLFIQALKHPEVLVRVEAAKVLGLFGAAAKTALPGLKALLEDKNEFVRQAAAEAIKKIEE